MSQELTHIGFIGLGEMGKHIAKNLMQDGVQLYVSTRSEQQFAFFRELGAKASTQVKDLAHCSIIFLCVPHDGAVRSVLLGENGLLPMLKEGQIVIDLSTINYSTTKEIATLCAEKGVQFLDAPISGMEARAKDGTLTVMIGGDEATFMKMQPYFAKIGTTILYMGTSGNGQLTKLINQLLFNINVAGLAEVLPLAAKMGLDAQKIGDVVNSGTGRSYASEFFIPRILNNSFEEGYALKNAYKDMENATFIGVTEKIPTPVLHAATTTYQMALCKGLGDKGKGAMIKVFEDLVGAQFRKK